MKGGIKRSADPSLPFGRSRIYELLSHALGEPSEEFLEFLRRGELFLAIKEVLASYGRRERVDLQAMGDALEDLLASDIEAVRSWYERLASPDSALLYEGKYHPPLNVAEEMADIAGFYRAFGFGFRGERPDHISFELDFMRLLSLKEAKALLDGDRENADLCRSAQGKFLSSHLGRWMRALGGEAEGVPFYWPVSRFLASWVEADCAHHRVKTGEIFPFLSGSRAEQERSFECGKEAR